MKNSIPTPKCFYPQNSQMHLGPVLKVCTRRDREAGPGERAGGEEKERAEGGGERAGGGGERSEEEGRERRKRAGRGGREG